MGSPYSRPSSDGESLFGSPKVQVVIPSPRHSFDQLPTPAASSQVEASMEHGNKALDYALGSY